jgi:hypothetical protein
MNIHFIIKKTYNKNYNFLLVKYDFLGILKAFSFSEKLKKFKIKISFFYYNYAKGIEGFLSFYSA